MPKNGEGISYVRYRNAPQKSGKAINRDKGATPGKSMLPDRKEPVDPAKVKKRPKRGAMPKHAKNEAESLRRIRPQEGFKV